MAYRCIDCSYSGSKFTGGACPACGSNNVRRVNANNAGELEAKKAKPYRLIFAVGLWCFLAVEIYKKLS